MTKAASNSISFTNPEVVKQLYKMGDKNQDGTIDQNEFKTGLSQMGLPENLCRAGWNIGDKNNDGKLSLDEALDLGAKYGHIGDKHCQESLNSIFGGGANKQNSAGAPTNAMSQYPSVEGSLSVTSLLPKAVA